MSDFINKRGGFLQLTEIETILVGASIPKTARVLLECGAEKDNY